ncbi:MAG: hypothetical protein LBH41_02690 [Rickettsiales bacterium]|nr:hypothetical protein [Rickettsiales bacterium]
MKRHLAYLILLCACADSGRAKYTGQGDVAKCRDYRGWCEKGQKARADGRQEYFSRYTARTRDRYIDEPNALRRVNDYEDGRLVRAERIFVGEGEPLVARSVARYYDWGAEIVEYRDEKFVPSSALCEYRDDIVHYNGQKLADNIAAGGGEFRCPR